MAGAASASRKSSWQQWPGGISVVEWRSLKSMRSLRVWMLVFWRVERYEARDSLNSACITVRGEGEEKASGIDGMVMLIMVAPRDCIFSIAAKDSFTICKYQLWPLGVSDNIRPLYLLPRCLRIPKNTPLNNPNPHPLPAR